MTPERYQKILHWLNAHPAAKRLVILLNHWLPAVPFVCYPVLLVLLNLQWFRLLRGGLNQTALDFMQCIARAILVPGFVFLGGTLLRKKLNFPRPYEQPGFTPLVPKETHGKSGSVPGSWYPSLKNRCPDSFQHQTARAWNLCAGRAGDGDGLFCSACQR